MKAFNINNHILWYIFLKGNVIYQIPIFDNFQENVHFMALSSTENPLEIFSKYWWWEAKLTTENKPIPGSVNKIEPLFT